MSHDHRQKDFFFGALVGSTLGAITAMVFTTKKGREIQQKFVDKYDDLTDTVQEYASNKKKAVKSKVKKYAAKADRKVNSSAKKIRKKIKKAQNKIEKKL